MKTRKCIIGILLLCVAASAAQAEENVRKVATWNMKWLGVNSGNQLDPVENVPQYVNYIKKTGATLFALQEIGATHSVEGAPRCYYLDLIVEQLNKDSHQWVYILDDKNKNQRLAFLYNQSLWSVTDAHTVWPGSSFRSARRPFVATIEAKGDNAELVFTYINIHLKAFPDAESRQTRAKNVEELAAWIEGATLDEDVLISGDTNIYVGETDTDVPFEDVNCVILSDQEKTAIHDGKLGQRFDRFFCSSDLKKEIDSAKNVVGSAGYIDVIKDNQAAKIKWFDRNISDHFAVVLHIDVSEER